MVNKNKHINKMKIQEITKKIIDIQLKDDNYSAKSFGCDLKTGKLLNIEYTTNTNEIIIIPYKAHQLIEQAILLIEMADYLIKNNTNILY